MSNNWKHDLEQYISAKKNPRFSAFVTSNIKSIPAWSMDIAANTPHGLHGAWVDRFAEIYMDIKGSSKRPEKSRFNVAIWEQIFNSFIRRKEGVQAFHEEAISTLTAAAPSAGREMRSLLDPSESIPARAQDIDHSANSSPSIPTTQSTRLSVSLSPPGEDRFFVDEVDVSEKFYHMQEYVFDLQLYAKIRKHHLDSWTTNDRFPTAELVKLIDLVQDVYDKKQDTYEAGAAILTMANTMNHSIDKKLVMSVFQLIQSLPNDATNVDISETILITRYLVPALQPLFDHRERNVRLEFTATNLANNQKRPPTFNGSPDCIITAFPHATDDGINIGFGEVKRSTMASDHFLVNWDLVRLAMFGKGAIDSNSVSANLAIHVVAPYVIYYIINLQADGLYTMTELDRIQLPMSILEIPSYLSNFTRLKNIIHIFESLCNPPDTTINTTWQRESLLATDITVILNKTKNRKRKNSSGHPYTLIVLDSYMLS